MRILSLSLVFSLCLIACVLPVSAADSLVDSEAVLTNQRQLFGASQSAYTATYFLMMRPK